MPHSLAQSSALYYVYSLTGPNLLRQAAPPDLRREPRLRLALLLVMLEAMGTSQNAAASDHSRHFRQRGDVGERPSRDGGGTIAASAAELRQSGVSVQPDGIRPHLSDLGDLLTDELVALGSPP